MAGAFLFQVLVIVGWLNFQRSGAANAAPALRRTMPRWLQSAFGIEGAQIGEITTFLTVASQHPFLLLIVLALPMAMLSDFIAGDQERRSMALILCRPVGRLVLLSTAWCVTVLRLSAVVAGSLVGVVIGSYLLPPATQINMGAVLLVHLNLLTLGWATAGLVLVPSVLGATRGSALGYCVGTGVLMYALHFVVQVLPSIKPLGRLTLFTYFNPGLVLLLGKNPWVDIVTLTLIGMAGWAVGLWLFRRRNLAL